MGCCYYKLFTILSCCVKKNPTPGFLLFPLDVGNVFVKYSLEEREKIQVGNDIKTRYYLYSNGARSGDSECFCTNNQGQVPNVMTKLFLVFFQGERPYTSSPENTWKLTEKALPIRMNVYYFYIGVVLWKDASGYWEKGGWCRNVPTGILKELGVLQGMPGLDCAESHASSHCLTFFCSSNKSNHSAYEHTGLKVSI